MLRTGPSGTATTYADAPPLTGIDPTGHYTSGLGVNTGNGGGTTIAGGTSVSLGSGGYSTSGYSSSSYSGAGDIAASTGTYSSNGGGHVCSDNICSATFVHAQWWIEHIASAEYILSQLDWDPKEAPE